MVSKHANNKSESGFTLVELMIVVSIIAILATIAIPSYNSSVRKTARGDAQGQLATAAMSMERHRAQNFTYVGAAVGTTFTRYSPDTANAASAKYELAFSVAPTATAFEIIARPRGDQAKGDNGVMKINQLGQRCWSKSPTALDCSFTTDAKW